MRVPVEADAHELQRLVSDREIAAGTLTIPHPYPPDAALQWIRRQAEREDGLSFAVELVKEAAVVGAISLELEPEHRRAELGYWIGRPHWGRGYATEAARLVLDHGFGALRLNRIYAFHFSNNPASGRVLQKLGMAHEGRRRAHTLKWGEFLDSECYGVLAADRESAG